MKRLIGIVLIICLSALSLSAQPGKRLYLFPEFVPGHFELHNRTVVDTRMNFDTAGQTVYYYDGEVLMEMTDLHLIKSLTVGDRVFVVRDGLLCERLDTPSGPVLVNWRFKNVNKGSKGAMGITTQGKVDVISSMNFGYDSYSPSNKGNREAADIHSVEVWEQANDNIYFFFADGDWHKVKSQKDLYRDFPAQAAPVKAYIKENRLSMSQTEKALKILGYLQGLLVQ